MIRGSETSAIQYREAGIFICLSINRSETVNVAPMKRFTNYKANSACHHASTDNYWIITRGLFSCCSSSGWYISPSSPTQLQTYLTFSKYYGDERADTQNKWPGKTNKILYDEKGHSDPALIKGIISISVIVICI